MVDVSSVISKVIENVIALIKGLVVFFVFANILFETGFDPLTGLMNLVDSFLGGGLAGLLAFLVFVWFMG